MIDRNIVVGDAERAVLLAELDAVLARWRTWEEWFVRLDDVWQLVFLAWPFALVLPLFVSTWAPAIAATSVVATVHLASGHCANRCLRCCERANEIAVRVGLVPFGLGRGSRR